MEPEDTHMSILQPLAVVTVGRMRKPPQANMDQVKEVYNSTSAAAVPTHNGLAKFAVETPG